MFLYLNIQHHVEMPASTESTVFKILSFLFREMKLNRNFYFLARSNNYSKHNKQISI